MHERNWPGVDRLLSALPSRLFRQAKLLEYDLAIRYSASGQFREVFMGAGQVPVMSIPAWLFDDLGLAESPERDRAEGHLFRASLLLAGRTHAIECLGDEHSFYGTPHLALVQHLTELATLELARAVPTDAPFWSQWTAISTDELERGLEMRERDAAPGSTDDPEVYLHGRWSAATKLTALAASAIADHEEVAPPLADLLDELTAAVQIRDDLASLTDDLERGRPTYPIETIAQAAGIPLRPWPEKAPFLGAMIATRSLATIHDAALVRLRRARERAHDLGLPTLAAYLDDATAGFEDRFSSSGGGIRLAPAASDRHPRSAGPDRRLEPTVEQALVMAEGFLLADPSYRESWESHREGMFGAELVASRFPGGMVLEILSRHGHELATPVDELLAFTVANGFRYFDHPWSGIDSDTVGVYLRLLPYATNGALALAAAGRVLDCLGRNVRERRSVPVWIRGCEDSSDVRPPVLDLGEGCGTVAAHLLLGLSTLGTADAREVFEIGASDLLGRIRDLGLGVNVNYPPLYALGTFLRLVSRLDAPSTGSELGRAADAAHEALLEDLDRARRARVLTAQHAALLISACLEAGRPGLIDPAWASVVLRQQRFDGSWSGEPFFAAPNRGRSVTWYTSTVLTSALCYDALLRSAGGGDGGRLEASL